MKNFRNILINSSILFVCAATVQTTLHELGHFAAALVIHAKNVTLHHNYVSADTAGMPLSHTIFYSAAGPVVSLLIGLGFHLVCSCQKKRNVAFLFNLYMAVFGYIAFFGYLMVAPFFTYGDTGYIFAVLNFSVWLTASLAITGGIVLYFVMRKLIRFFVQMGTTSIIADKHLRRKLMNSLIQYPLYIGVLITTLLNLPVPSVLSLLYPICSPFSLMWVYGDALSGDYTAGDLNTDIGAVNRIQPVWVVVLFLIVVINRGLVGGVVVK